MVVISEMGAFRKVLILAVTIGTISGFGAVLFFKGLKLATGFFMGDLLGYHMPLEGQTVAAIATWAPPPVPWLIIPVICAGGLVSGIIIAKFAPEAAGHGTDAAIRAFHSDGRIRKRIPFLKALTAIITIGTGGSAGREGPTAQISAGFGTMVADWLGMSARDRRLALATGIGTGIGTIFKAPLGGAILAAEILYRRDFESEAIVPAFLASVIGYAIFGFFEGFDPVFGTAGITWNVTQLPFFLVLGAICAGFGALYIRVFYGTTGYFNNLFLRRGIPPHFKPLAGAFLTGVIVVALIYLFPRDVALPLASLGTGYGFMQLAIYSMLPLTVLLLLPFLKILTTSLTIGSGGSGGVFAPGLTIGGAVGGALGTVLHILFPSLVPLSSILAFVVVGMVALFGGVSNAPIAVLIMVVEMTGQLSILIPSMGAVAISAVLMGEESIYREQVETRADSSAHRGEYLVEVLKQITVESAMVPLQRIRMLSPADRPATVISLIDETGHTGFPVVENGRLMGMVTIRDARHTGEPVKGRLIRDCMTRKLITVTPDQNLETALSLMMRNDIHHLPVTDPAEKERLVGYLTSTDIMRAYTRTAAEISRSREEEEQAAGK